MVQLLTLDPRFPLPDSLSLSDPSHPLNLLKQTKETQEQAAKDREFDPPLPKRLSIKEAFQTERTLQSVFFVLVLILLTVYACTTSLEQVLQIILLFVGIAGLLVLYKRLTNN
jgi:hypothetical protein